MSVFANGLMKKAKKEIKNNYQETGFYETNAERIKREMKINKRYKKYIIGKIVRDEKGNESFVYFPLPVEESDYAKENNVDMSKLFVIRDLIVIHLTDPNGNYGLDPKLKRFVHIEEE